MVHGTRVEWIGNHDPNAPEASKVPRSQKYWDKHNIERPDYAKTDAEIMREKLLSDKDSTLNAPKLLFVLALFGALWAYIFMRYTNIGRMGERRQGKGQKLGSAFSSSTIFALRNDRSGDGSESSKSFRFGIGTADHKKAMNMDEQVRLARIFLYI